MRTAEQSEALVKRMDAAAGVVNDGVATREQLTRRGWPDADIEQFLALRREVDFGYRGDAEIEAFIEATKRRSDTRGGAEAREKKAK